MNDVDKYMLELKAQSKIKTTVMICNEFVSDYLEGRVDRLSFNAFTKDLRLKLETVDKELKEINDDINSCAS